MKLTYEHLLKGIIALVGARLLGDLLWHRSSYAATPPGPIDLRQKSRREAWEYREPLAPGKPGTFRTLQIMAWLVRRDAGDPVVRGLATDIVSRCAGHDFLCEIEACFEFVRDAITYRRDPVSVERVQDARRTLKFGCGDCDDKSVLLATLLAAVGHKCRFCVLGNKRSNFSHVYVEVFTPRGWVALDPTNEQACVGWQGRGVIKQSYPIFD